MSGRNDWPIAYVNPVPQYSTVDSASIRWGPRIMPSALAARSSVALRSGPEAIVGLEVRVPAVWTARAVATAITNDVVCTFVRTRTSDVDLSDSKISNVETARACWRRG